MAEITELYISALAKYREVNIDIGLLEQDRWNRQNETIQWEVNRLIRKVGTIQRDPNFQLSYENDIALFKSMKALLLRKWYKNLLLQAEHLRFLESEKKFLLRMENFARSTLNLEEARDWDINVETVAPDPVRHGVDESVDDNEEDI